MKDILNKLTRKFLLNEGYKPDIRRLCKPWMKSFLTGVQERKEKNRLDLAREHHNIKGHYRRVNRQLQELQERLTVLEEEKKEVK